MKNTIAAKRHLLAIMAHPDDAEMWVGGTLAKHARTGRASILIACDDPIRTREAEAGAAILGTELRVTTGGPLLFETCLEVIGTTAADVVICHRWDDPHPDHRRIGMLVTGVVQKAAIILRKRIHLYVCDTYESLTLDSRVPGSAIVNVDDSFDVKMSALQAHVSQPLSHFSSMAERQARTWGARIGATWAEAFDPVPVLGLLPGRDAL